MLSSTFIASTTIIGNGLSIQKWARASASRGRLKATKEKLRLPLGPKSIFGLAWQNRKQNGRAADPCYVHPPLPPPWSVEEQKACFVVRDANRQALGYSYFEEEPGRRSAAKLLSKDKARRIAANVAKLLELLR
jgi:hypothetical protein